jgi:hypothetical protein
MKFGVRARAFLWGMLLFLVSAPIACASTPTIVTTQAYLNGTPLTAHTTAALNSTGATTLVAFIGTHPTWNGQSVSISSVTDNLNNSWHVLCGPTSWTATGTPLLSAVYYVNAPATSSNQTITVTLTNGAPLVLHVFAVSGSDTAAPPIAAPITDPGLTAGSTDVISQPISVPAGSLVLGWAKNQEFAGSVTALSGFTLDQQSTSFLWAESQTAVTAGSYSTHFQFPILTGWQTTEVGIRPASTTFSSVPAVLTSKGYINTTPLTAHTTAAFNSSGATTLVAFIGTHPTWNGQPVSISGVSDNLNNSWQVLSGPTSWTDTTGFPLLSAVYYVNAPITGNQQTITVTLTNAAPLVLHVFAASGSDISSPPVSAAITDPGPNGATTDVVSQAISVPAGSLLLGWAKNQGSVATATALDGFTLDAESVPFSFLWAESQPVLSSGSYAAHFQFSASAGWQTTVVGLRAASTAPIAQNQSLRLRQATNVTISAASPLGASLTYAIVSQPSHGALSGAAPNVTYTPDAGYVGSDSFTFKANDGASDSNIATVSITVLATDHPPVAIDGTASISSRTISPISLIASDPDNDPLTFTIVTPPAHGQLSGGTGANRTYTPASGYLGADSFTFKANDGTLDSNVAQFTISVTPATFSLPAGLLSSKGYINGTPLTAHTTAAFNSSGATTLVAFVSTHPTWDGQPISIAGVTDNQNNTWHVLSGPTTWSAATGTPLLSAVYYVNAPATASQHAITVALTNAAPLVLHVFAVSGSDISGPPISAAITDPRPNSASSDVVSQAINVPAGSLVLGWAKNQDFAGQATALDGFTLDQAESVSFLWAESQPVLSSGSYAAHFQFASSVGWQTTVVAVKPVRAIPSVNWPIPDDITYGTPLSATQLNATAEVDGTFDYSPPIGTMLNAGTGQTLSVTFTPSDTSSFSTVTKTVTINVRKADQSINFGALANKTFGDAPFTLTGSDSSGLPITYNVISGPATISLYTVTFTGAGTVTIQASQSGDARYNAATSVNRSFTVAQAATSTSIVSNANPSTAGQSLTFTAVVSPVGGRTPTGSIAFNDGANPLGTSVALDGTGRATLTTAALAAGTHAVTGIYSGDTTFLGSTSSVLTQTVRTPTTTSTPASNLNPSTYGQTITFTATVNSSTATGTIQFFDGPTLLGGAPVNGGSASFSTSAVSAGSRLITAVYSGDGQFAPSTSATALTETVNKATTTSAVTSNVAQQQYSDLVTVTATLSPTSAGAQAPANGVIFSIGSQQLNTTPLPLVNVNGTLTATLSNYALLETVSGQLKPGAHFITATYTGVSPNFTVSNVSRSISITREDARTSYTGPTSVSTGSSTTSTATIPLSFTVKDITAAPTDPAYDVHAGDIGLATVTFVNRSTGAAIATVNVAVTPIPNDPNNHTVGTATYNWSVDLGTATSQTFTVGTIVNSYYTRNSAIENATITVFKP